MVDQTKFRLHIRNDLNFDKYHVLDKTHVMERQVSYKSYG